MQSYIDYVQNVLGVKSILHSAPQAAEQVQTAEAAASLIYFVLETEMKAEERELFDKIVAAIKLTAQDFRVVLASALAQGEWAVVMSSNPLEAQKLLIDLSPAKTLFTYSPKALLAKPELKREVWENLKKFMVQKQQAS